MSDRPTKTFTTESGHTAVFYTYLTGGEADSVKQALYSTMKMKPTGVVGEKPEMSEVSASFLIEQERATLRALLVSIDGKTEDPLTELLNLPSQDADAIKEAINAETNPTTPSNTETPGEGTSKDSQ